MATHTLYRGNAGTRGSEGMPQEVVKEFFLAPIATLGGAASILSLIVAVVLAVRGSERSNQPGNPLDSAEQDGALRPRRHISYAAVISRSLFVLAAVCGFAMVADRIVASGDWKAIAAALVLYALSTVVSAYLLSVLLSHWILQNLRVSGRKGGQRAPTVHDVPYPLFVISFAGVVISINASAFVVLCIERLFSLWWGIMGNPSFESGGLSFYVLPIAYTLMLFGFVSMPLYIAIKFIFKTQIRYAASRYGSDYREALS
jgi:hypothetical protein